jgi:hypothetical protein
MRKITEGEREGEGKEGSRSSSKKTTERGGKTSYNVVHERVAHLSE